MERSWQLTRSGEAPAMVFQRLMASRILPKARRFLSERHGRAWHRAKHQQSLGVQAMQPTAGRFTSRASISLISLMVAPRDARVFFSSRAEARRCRAV